MAIEPTNAEVADQDKMEDLMNLKTLNYEEASKLIIPRLEEIDITIAEFKKELPDLIKTTMWDIEDERIKKEEKRQKDLKDKRSATIAIWKKRLGLGTGGSGVFILLDTMVRLFLV